MIHKRFEDIGSGDILALVANQVPESRTLDYKEALPANIQQDEQKREFLADVSSFANASGGDIIFGVKEGRDQDGKSTGLPDSICGIDEGNFDNLILRMQQIIRDGVEPRLAGVQLKPVLDVNGMNVFIIRVPKSWQSPHMLSGKVTRFYTRTSAGKHQMDVTEIRAAFDLSRDLESNIRNFRASRINRIITGDTPVPLEGTSRIVLQVIPLTSFSAPVSFDMRQLYRNIYKLPLISTSGGYSRYNFDGIVNHSGIHNGQAMTYLQVFRNGIIEIVDTYLVMKDQQNRDALYAYPYEQAILKNLKTYIDFQEGLGLAPPFLVNIALMGVRNTVIAVDSFHRGNQHPITEDVLQLPEVFIEDSDFSVGLVLKPIFDVVWQSGGYEATPNINNEGKWIGR